MLRDILLMTLFSCCDLVMLHLIWCILYEFLEGSTKMYKKVLAQVTTKEKITMSFVEKYVREKKNRREVLCYKRYYWFYRIAMILIPIKYVVTIIIVAFGSFEIAKKICFCTIILLALITKLEMGTNKKTPHRDREYRRK